MSSNKATEPSGWQAQKSAATRKLIVESAIACFIELGYARTTTSAIAAKAGVSRGAMLHHFHSKSDVVRAAVEHLHAKRIKAFLRAGQRTQRGNDRIRSNLNAYWQHVRHPLFVAFFELMVAARTDAELAAILQPAQQAFEDEWHRTAKELFPEWPDDNDNFDVALDLTRHVIEGMAISLMVTNGPERDQRVLAYLEEQLRALRGVPQDA